MAYTNATFYLDPISGSDSARTALTSCTASNPSGTIARINKTAHGLVTGAVVDLTLFSAWLNDAFSITRVDADNFDLDNTVWQATADASGTATPRGGMNKADAWKTFSSGATNGRITAGDTIRTIASVDPTSLGQTATWTKASKTVTLTTAVTADIDTGESAWTASANVTSTTSSTRKEGSLSASNAIAVGFVTGLAAYKAMSATDFSAYQQISLWIQVNAAFTAGQLQIKLCSDNAGVTAVNTFNLPAMPVANVWMPVTVDNAGALGASIQSVALYVAADFGAVTVLTDNIIACKTAGGADSLSLQSLIGKVWNLNWAASTTYASNDIRKPTSPNRNGFRYKVTAGGGGSSGSSEPTWPTDIGATVTDGALTWTCDSLEETWDPIQSIRGTTILLDSGPGTLASSGRGYGGTTETVTTYKREPLLLTPQSGTTAILGAFQDSGSASARLTFSGGWDRTNMTVQSGETWLSGQGSTGTMYDCNGKSFLTLSNLNSVNCNNGFFNSVSGGSARLENCHAVGSNTSSLSVAAVSTYVYELAGFVASNNTGVGISAGADTQRIAGRCVAMSNNTSHGYGGNSGVLTSIDLSYVELKNNGGYGANAGATTRTKRFSNVVASDNSSGTFESASTDFIIGGTCTDTDSTIASAATNFSGTGVYINNLNGGGAKLYIDGGTIAQATDQRNTASGYSWKFNPTSTARSTFYPLVLSVAKVACSASSLVTLTIYVRRDSTNIAGRLMVKGGQIAGVGADAYTDCTPSANTWTQYTRTFTPTADGVVEVTFEAYDGAGTTNSLWIDDFTASQ
ncbi:MAG: hypothetical protein RLZZ373_2670 [Pseudomonadota bacterium]